MKTQQLGLVPGALAMVALIAVSIQGARADVAPTSIPPDYLYSFAPLPARFESPTNPITDAKLELGHMLYFEPRLSKNHDIPCSSCHPLDTFGVDNKPVSLGHRNQLGTRNSPTVYNAAGLVAQFWDGRATDVEDQAGQPVLNPIEMAMPDEARAVATLRSMPEYVERFARAFPGQAEPLTYANMGAAIGAFERVLVTPDRFDAYLNGDTSALTAAELHGFRRFVELGCAACHNGPTLGGATFEFLGLIADYPDKTDQGVWEVSKKDADRMLFRTPGLRNVVPTAPYFHDGSIADLAVAIRLMGRHQLGLSIAEVDVTALLAFMNALTGKLPEKWLKEPTLPPSTAATPPPDTSPTAEQPAAPVEVQK